MKKVIELIVSERNDFWMETMQVNEGETLREALQRRGFDSFRVSAIDLDDVHAIHDGMTVRVHISSGRGP
jgi:hypothetical protein